MPINESMKGLILCFLSNLQPFVWTVKKQHEHRSHCQKFANQLTGSAHQLMGSTGSFIVMVSGIYPDPLIAGNYKDNAHYHYLMDSEF